MNQLRSYLRDFLVVTGPFRDKESISHILMKKDGQGRVISAASAKNGTIAIEATAVKKISEFENTACLGSLNYLQSLLESKMVDDDGIKINYLPSGPNSMMVARTIEFQGGNKFRAKYNATDPFINKVLTQKKSVTNKWPILMKVGPQLMLEYAETAKIHSSAPKIGGDRDDLFMLSCTNGEVKAEFGDNNNRTEIILANVETPEGTNVRNYMSIRMISSLFRLFDGNIVDLFMAQNEIKFVYKSDFADYSFNLPAKRIA